VHGENDTHMVAGRQIEGRRRVRTPVHVDFEMVFEQERVICHYRSQS